MPRERISPSLEASEVIISGWICNRSRIKQLHFIRSSVGRSEGDVFVNRKSWRGILTIIDKESNDIELNSRDTCR